MATVETANIHALRLALEQFDLFVDATAEVELDDLSWRSLDRYIDDIRSLLEHELRNEEHELIKSMPLG